MEEKNELNDIILNKNGSAGNNKKIILAVATLGVILIIVIMLMNTLSSNNADNLPKAVLPPEPKAVTNQLSDDEPLFEEVPVIQESSKENNSLNEIAKKLKKESQKEKLETEMIDAPIHTISKTTKKIVKETTKKINKQKSIDSSKTFYVQVGSFSKYKPNKKFLKSIVSKGFKYKYHKVVKNSKTLTKVLVGPFFSEKKARAALKVIKNDIQADAFLTKI